jgi:hypothetical protein
MMELTAEPQRVEPSLLRDFGAASGDRAEKSAFSH